MVAVEPNYFNIDMTSINLSSTTNQTRDSRSSS